MLIRCNYGDALIQNSRLVRVSSENNDMDQIIFDEINNRFFIIRKDKTRQEYSYTQVEPLPPNLLLQSSYDDIHDFKVLSRLGKVIEAKEDCRCGIKRAHKHCAICGRVLTVKW